MSDVGLEFGCLVEGARRQTWWKWLLGQMNTVWTVRLQSEPVRYSVEQCKEKDQQQR